MKTICTNTLNKKIFEEWIVLWNTSQFANYTNSPYWFLNVIERYNFKKYTIIALYENDKLIAIGGLVKQKVFGKKVFTVAPNDFVCGNPFLIDITKTDQMIAFLNELFDIGTVFLDNVPHSFIKALSSLEFPMDTYPFSKNYYLSLENENALHFYKNFNRKIKGFEQDFTTKTYKSNDKEALKAVFAIDNNSSKKLLGYNCFTTKSIKKFYIQLLAYFEGKARIDILFYKEKPIAYELGFIVSGTYFESQNAYLESMKHFNPGNVLTAKMIQSFMTQEIKKVNFGSGDTEKKRRITQDYELLYKVVISRNPILRFHFKNVSKLKATLYSSLKSHKKMYTMYRRLKRK